MTHIVIQIKVEVFCILGIATKEIKQGQPSEWSFKPTLQWTESFSEKYLKKLLGGRDIDDSPKSLDKQTRD